MKSPRARSVSAVFLLSCVDRLGRAIDPLILEVAHEVGPRAVAYAVRLLGDSALALDLFEEAAGAVSQAIKRKSASDAGRVRDLSAYLFRTYLRKIGLARSKQTRLDKVLQMQMKTQREADVLLQAEVSLLFDEVMATYDKVTRQIVYRRLEGFSWKEIGAEFGIKAHAAEVRYSRALANARKTFSERRRFAG